MSATIDLLPVPVLAAVIADAVEDLRFLHAPGAAPSVVALLDQATAARELDEEGYTTVPLGTVSALKDELVTALVHFGHPPESGRRVESIVKRYHALEAAEARFLDYLTCKVIDALPTAPEPEI